MSKEQSKVHAKLRDGIEGWQEGTNPSHILTLRIRKQTKEKKGNGVLDQAQSGQIST